MNISLHLPRELVAKMLQQGRPLHFKDFLLTVKSSECITPAQMANQRAADKRILTLWLPRTLFARLEKLAESRGETLTQLITNYLTPETQNTELSPEDYRKIADETEQARKRLSQR
jgi:hypothetical protein